MSAPSNDNWGNATTIRVMEPNSCWGSVPFLATNISASSEAGEPPNSGSTVWFVWVCEHNGNYSFSTRYGETKNMGFNFATSQTFPTTVQVFTGASVSTLTEISYITNYGAGWDNSNESAVIFSASLGISYYIRVDSRISGSTGQFAVNLNYNCLPTTCDCPVSSSWGTQIASVEERSVLIAPCKYPFIGNFGGHFPAGTYTVAYCCGAFVWAETEDSFLWTVDYWDSAEPTDKQWVYYNSASVQVKSPFPNTASIDTGEYASAESLAMSHSIVQTFVHSGGAIYMSFEDSAVFDNINGNPANPTFGLYSNVTASVCCFDCSSDIVTYTNNCIGNANVFNFTITNPTSVPTTGRAYMVVGSNFSTPNAYIEYFTPANGTTNLSYPISIAPLTVSSSASITGSLIVINPFTNATCSVLNFSASAVPTFTANGGCVNWNSSLSKMSGSLIVALNSVACNNGSPYSFTLANGGGVTGASATYTQTIPQGISTVSVPITFTPVPISNQVIATLNINDVNGILVGTVVFNLTPFPVFSKTALAGCLCGPNPGRNLTGIVNLGLMQIKGLKFVPIGSFFECTTFPPVTHNLGDFLCNSTNTSTYFSSCVANSYTVSDSLFSYGTYTFT
jgi:hypothetical protein